MRTRTTRLIRVALVSLSLGAAALAAPRTAHAEADRFGVGDGHRGAYIAGAVDEVINAYAPLAGDVAAGATQAAIGAVVGDPAGFVANDLVLILRATGVPENFSPSASQVPIDLAVVAGGVIGTFEFARVQAIVGSTITFTAPLVRPFAKDVTQIIKVPEFTTVNVPAGTSIGATPWQRVGGGFAGGVIVFLATGAVTVGGLVNADLRGFRGGAGVQRVANLASQCQNDDGTVDQGYAPKGEGVVSTEFGEGKGGRGNRSIAAGGGNCVENGGAGGGNKGQGGQGGDSIIVGVPGQAKAALGGAAINYSLLSRMSFGGGGGAGEQKNGLGSGGGRGGGGIFIRARSLGGTGRLTANGEAAANAQLVGVESDGAGGGGAGGSIAIRLVGDAICAGLDAKGAKGGDSAQLGLSFFGPGGGGAGGRVLLQAKSTNGCPVTVTPGGKGTANGIDRNAKDGFVGENEPIPAPGGNYCFSNPATDPQCANPAPVCDTTSGFCNKCTGPFGGGTPRACTVATQPVCATNGACNACDGDFGVGTTNPCQVFGSPVCFTGATTPGACGKCTTNDDCIGPGHAGPACNPTIGACGTACQNDSECKSTEWCAQNVCVSKTPNSEPVPTVPPIDGECTVEKGKRVCLSAACEPDDDLCGLKNGSPCEGVGTRCRSTICFSTDQRCGKPTGEPCASNGECRSLECKNGICTGCTADTDCKTGQVCDPKAKQCITGCREIAGKSNCPAGKVCSKKDGTIGQCLPGPDDTNPNPISGDLIEGGGCACRTSLPSSAGSPLALAAAAVLGTLVVRRRRQRRLANEEAHDKQDSSDE